jgi:tRNA (guanine-N7-)-methyltransferase
MHPFFLVKATGGLYVHASMETFDPYLHLNELAALLRWADAFGNDAPVEIEIGIGKGSLLRRMAAGAPERNFVGVERANKYLRIAGQRIARDRQTNLRLVHTDAIYFLEKFVPDASVAAFHIYFSDPWPKKRHAKRRFFQSATVQLLEAKTAPGGMLHVRTDVDWYWADIVALFEAETRFEIVEKGEAPIAAIPPEMQTNFEIKYRAVGKVVWFVTLRKPERAQVGAVRS